MKISLLFIIFLLLCTVIRFLIVRARCKTIGQKVSLMTFLRIPQLYELVTNKNRGTESERRIINKLMKAGLKPTAVYHDLLIKDADGKSHQIDIVVATDVGLVVIEVKDYIGWIFGKGNQDTWTQVTSYGRNKHRFYNPFKQNQGHIKALRSLSEQFETLPMYSLVVFSDDCELKDVRIISKESYLAKESSFYKAILGIIEENPVAQYSDRWDIANKLKEASDNGANLYSQDEHVYKIHDMLGTNRRYE